MPNMSKQFLKACQNDPIAALNLLQRFSTINVNIRNCNNKTPLHFVVAANHIELITTLLERGADPNAQNDAGDTPLHEAVRNRNSWIISLLLSAGASLESKNIKEQTPIDLASLYGHMTLSKAIQISCQRLETQKQQGLVRMEMLKQAIAEQEQFITNHEEMIRQHEQNPQQLQSRVHLTNAQTFEELQTLASLVSLPPTAKRQKTISASPFFDDTISRHPLIPQASKSAVASTSTNSTSQITPSGLL